MSRLQAAVDEFAAMGASMGDWKPGDRVQVCLPVVRPGKRRSSNWVPGTVREIDPPGLRPGVRVDLDYPVHGISDCFATHAELRAS